MIGTKEGKFLKFTLDDGKVVKYDLSTGQSRRAYNAPISSEEFGVLKKYEEYLNKKSEE